MGGWPGTGVRTMTGAVLAAVLAVAGCTSGRSASTANTTGSAVATPASSATGGFQPGAAGAGDPYYPTYGNGGYDVASYLLKLRYDPAANELDGQETITATATANLSRFDLDFAGLTVNSITVNGRPATNSRDQNELRVTPAAGLRSGSTFTVAVDYGGAPQPVSPGLGVGGFLHDKDGAIAVGQPESAAAWFPVNDHPSDKATYQIEITVPEGLSAISNGVLQGSTTAGGWTTWKWAEQAPMASYLATLAIGKYRVTTSQHDGKPVLTAVASALPVGSADQAMARTVEIADFLTTQFGPYPFDAYGGIVVADTRVGFALETQTRPVYGPSFFRGSNGTWVVAHELAHQWYGDSVALERWQDIWLNEGFATYAEWLWTEHTGGDSVQQSFRSVYASVSDEVWRTPPGNPGVANLFSTSVYKRGAMTLQALRLTVGDNAFFRIIKEWAAEKRNGNGTTAEFITLAEKLSGKSLRPMFNAWLYQKTKPALAP